MKGTLHKTDDGWMVKYSDMQMLPIHPQSLQELFIKSDKKLEDREGEVVDFEIRDKVFNDGKGFTYAKLIHHPVDTNEMIDHIGEVNEMVDHVPDVGKMVEDDVVKLAEEYAIKVYHAFEDATWFRPLNLGYYAGYTKAKESLFTEEQVRDAIRIATTTDPKSEDYIIKSLKQSKQ